MQYNQEAGVKAGGSGLSEGGAHICVIEEAKYSAAQTGSHGIEFSLDVGGLKAKYITLYYAKQDKTPINSGQNGLNAIMGILGLSGLSFVAKHGPEGQVNVIPELEGKTVGLFLQKRLYSKRDGSDSYGFDIRVPFDPQTKQTLREKVDGKQASAIDAMSASYADKDDRNSQSQPQSSPGGAPQYADPADQGGW